MKSEKLQLQKFVLRLKELGIDNLAFNTRKTFCSLAYLLTVFEVNIGLPLSSFKWYLHGVYNPEITKLLAKIEESSKTKKVKELGT